MNRRLMPNRPYGPTIAILITLFALTCANTEELRYPQVVRVRYEAADPKAGGNFTIWLDRETLRLGLDQRLYPAVKYVDVTHLTPAPGSPLVTLVEVMGINAAVPDYYHIGGIVRFKVGGMILKSSNVPQ